MGRKQRSSPRRSIIKDAVHPQDFQQLNVIYACEQCSYYGPESKSCVLGYRVKDHQREMQMKSYNLNGRMAFCRFLEID